MHLLTSKYQYVIYIASADKILILNKAAHMLIAGFYSPNFFLLSFKQQHLLNLENQFHMLTSYTNILWRWNLEYMARERT